MDPQKTSSHWLDKGQVALDRELDTALAQYAAVEPRAGLEERIVANLRAQSARTPQRSWWRWSVAIGLAATVVIVAVGLTWRSVHPSHPAIANHFSTARPVAGNPPVLPSATGNTAVAQVRRLTSRAPVRPADPPAAAAVPKLDQFPSPQPSGEEELALAQYVRNFPTDAKVVAQAQEADEKEILAKMQALANESGESN